MSDLLDKVHKLYQQQPADRFDSEDTFFSEIKRVAQELHSRQPKGVDLSEEAFVALLVSFQHDFSLDLNDIERRLTNLPDLIQNLNQGANNG